MYFMWCSVLLFGGFFAFFVVQNLPIKYHASIIADKIYGAMLRNESKIGRRNILVYFLVNSAKVLLGNW